MQILSCISPVGFIQHDELGSSGATEASVFSTACSSDSIPATFSDGGG